MNHCMYVLYRSIFVRIFVSTNPQYDGRLITELQVKYMKILSSNLGRTCCKQKLFPTFRTILVNTMYSPCSAKRRVSDKYLPVHCTVCSKYNIPTYSKIRVTTIVAFQGLVKVINPMFPAHKLR